MKILVLNDLGIYGGGAETRIRILLEQLSKSDRIEDIYVVRSGTILQNNNSVASSKISKIHLLEDKGHVVKTLYMIYRLIKDKGIDLVQVHNLVCLSPLTILAAKICRRPVVWFAHDYWVICGQKSFIRPFEAEDSQLCQAVEYRKCIRCIGLKPLIRQMIYKILVNLSDMAVAPAHFVKDLYQRHNVMVNKWKVIAPWYNTDIFGLTNKASERKSAEKIILFVGSLADYKGAWVLARAAKYITKKFPEVKFKFIGDGGPGNRFRTKIENICLHDGTFDHIEIYGYVSHEQLVMEYARATVFVNPTVCMELFGLTWAEAMASGCPVVASQVGSLPELIKDNALLFKVSDPVDLAKAVIYLLENEERRSQISRRAREYVIREFNINRAADQIIDIYMKIKDTVL